MSLPNLLVFLSISSLCVSRRIDGPGSDDRLRAVDTRVGFTLLAAVVDRGLYVWRDEGAALWYSAPTGEEADGFQY